MNSGTFEATGDLYEFTVNTSINLALKFGTGTVKLQRWMAKAAEWIDVSGGSWTADTADIIYSGSRDARFRLTCTAHTADIMWELG